MFTDTHSIVTGAASGIGATAARMISEQGGQVTLLDIDAEAGKAVAESLGQDFVALDVRDHAAWENFASTLSAPVDYLYLNAGIQIAPPAAPMSEYEFLNMRLDRYRNMMGVNVDGVVFGLFNLLPHMQSGGSIVVTSSLAGITPYAVDPLYAMSKHAVSGLVRSLAQDCDARGLTINAICPGGVDTNIIPEAQRQGAVGFMEPEDIAAEVLQLFATEVNGKTWAKVSAAKPAWIIRAPGDKGT